jgi:hypothetical protein
LPTEAPPGLLQPVGRDSLPALEELTLREYDPLPFVVQKVILDQAATTSWFLEIRDPRGQPIRRLSGTGAPPARISWDWRDADGRLIEETGYTYLWGWTDGDGGTYTTPERSLRVVWEIRERTLRFGRDVVSWENRAEAYPILLLEERPTPAVEPENEAEPVRE